MALEALTMTAETGAGLAENERDLVAAARHDPEAAGRLFDRHYPEIIRYIYHSTLNHSVAEELTSNVFFAAFRHLGLFRWRGIRVSRLAVSHRHQRDPDALPAAETRAGNPGGPRGPGASERRTHCGGRGCGAG